MLLRNQALTVLLGWLLPYCPAFAEADSTEIGRRLTVKTHLAFGTLQETAPGASRSPFGLEVEYGRVSTRRGAWEHGNCFSYVGAYASFYDFGHPKVLGRTVGAGLYYEPMLWHRPRTQVGVRLSAGMTYLNRVYNEQTNPLNRSFSMPVSFLIGAGLHFRQRLNDKWNLVLSGNYHHISNGGTRQPNRGLNVRTLSVGMEYQWRRPVYPSTRQWRRAAPVARWMNRAQVFTSVRVMPADDEHDERVFPVLGTAIYSGYHLTRQHALSAGLELVDDRFFREELRRNQNPADHKQATLLAGYEYWHGRFVLTAHMAWNFYRPRGYNFKLWQRYTLLYRFPSGLNLGAGIKADGEVTKGFSAVAGWNF
ncbi:acyloxyacyl hydrolase [Tellurirhabdus rosea]|uniref:acyloxyacyl hydrolase n=1 Tax=Tellurirhabdus rosea TaxID=2674997 RepID=UPI00225741F3|nr:acyloxyacyl hydrolase [Tellurirhabdus rosea]